MHESCYFTYIMASRSRMLYIGITGELEVVVEIELGTGERPQGLKPCLLG